MRKIERQTPKEEAIEIYSIYGFEKGKDLICREMFLSGNFSYWRDVNSEFFEINKEFERVIKDRNPLKEIEKLKKKGML